MFSCPGEDHAHVTHKKRLHIFFQHGGRRFVNTVLFDVYRFKIQNKFNLRSVLPAMGISDAFNPTAADFTGISGKHINAGQDKKDKCGFSTQSSSCSTLEGFNA